MKQKRVDWYYLFLLFAAVSLCLIYQISTFHTEIMLACMALGIPIWISRYKSIPKNGQALLLLSLLFLSIVVLYKLFGVSSCDNDAIATYIDWTVILVFAIYLPSSGLSHKGYFLFGFLIWFLTTIQLVGAILDSNALFNSGNYDTESVRITEFGSMAMFFAAGCLLWFLHDKRFGHRLLSLVGIALSIYVIVVVQQRAINVICTVMLLLAILFVNGKSKKRLKHFAWVLIAAVLFVYFSQVYLLIFDFLIDTVKSVRLAERIADLKDFLATGNLFAEGRFSGRPELLKVSLSSWLQNPISFMFGVGDHRGDNSIVGNHSEYIDLLARYGLVGGFLCIATTVFLVRLLLSFSDKTKKARSQIWIVAFIFVFRNVIGIVSVYEVGIPLLLFTQAVLVVSRRKQLTPCQRRFSSIVRVKV